MMSLSFRTIAVQYLILLISLSFHEFGHAWTAHKMGDSTPQSQGRLTLNPLAHMDLIGTLILPLLMMSFASPLGIWGWAKPVEINPHSFKNKKWGDLLVTLAGPFSNLLLALIASIAALFLFKHSLEISQLMRYVLQINCLLFVFNMIPVPPLDGSFLLKRIVQMREETFLYFSQWGFVIIILLIQFPFFQKIIYFFLALSMTLIYDLSQLICWPFLSIIHFF